MPQLLSLDDYETRIRERAHQLWEQAGRPDGLSDHFWYAAQQMFEAEHPEFARRHAGAPQPDLRGDPTIAGDGSS